MGDPTRRPLRSSDDGESGKASGGVPKAECHGVLALAVASQICGAGLHNSTEHRSGTGSAPHIGLRHIPLRPARLLAPLRGSDWDAPALGGFYYQAFNGLVSLPVAGYNYNSDWTPSVGGTCTRWNGSSLCRPVKMGRIVCPWRPSRPAAFRPHGAPTRSLAAMLSVTPTHRRSCTSTPGTTKP